MITLPGTLLVKTIHGRRGDFAVGNLITEIGEFKVKDTILDQFSEGEYRGRFALVRVYQGTYAWKGATISELRANITDIELEDVAEKSVPAADGPVVADPIDEPVTTEPTAPPPVPAGDTASTGEPLVSAEPATDEFEAALAALTPVKLDPTVDRALFREQRDRLKTAGYRFDAAVQTWQPTAAGE